MNTACAERREAASPSGDEWAAPRTGNSEHRAEAGGETAELRDKVKRLEQDLVDSQIANRGKDMFIEQMQSERREFMDALQTNSHKIGVLETKLLQLEAPASSSQGGPPPAETPRYDERRQETYREPEVRDYAPEPTTAEVARHMNEDENREARPAREPQETAREWGELERDEDGRTHDERHGDEAHDGPRPVSIRYGGMDDGHAH